MKDTSEFIKCECGGHGLLLDYYICDDPNMPFEPELFISPLGSDSYWRKPNLWQRIKMAWRILKTGKGPEGEVVLSENNTATLVAYLNNFLIRSEK